MRKDLLQVKVQLLHTVQANKTTYTILCYSYEELFNAKTSFLITKNKNKSFVSSYYSSGLFYSTILSLFFTDTKPWLRHPA